MFENTQNTLNTHTAQSHKNKQAKFKPLSPLQPTPPNSQKRAMKRLGPYQFSIEQKIGSGMAGDAYVGINSQSCELVCVKVIDRSVFKTPNQQLLLQNEIRCQKACNSNYTVKIHDIFDTPSFCFIITEFCEGGDLYRCLRATSNGLPEAVAIQFGRQIALALKVVKDAEIVHRDIKSQNILIHKNSCKLGDFGFAIQQKKLALQNKFNLGSPLYMSIEALQSSIYSLASDIFSYGVVLYEMLHRQSPWECSDQKELLHKLKTEQPAFKSSVSKQMKTLISRCLSQRPQDRPTIESILESPIFKNMQGQQKGEQCITQPLI